MHVFDSHNNIRNTLTCDLCMRTHTARQLQAFISDVTSRHVRRQTQTHSSGETSFCPVVVLLEIHTARPVGQTNPSDQSGRVYVRTVNSASCIDGYSGDFPGYFHGPISWVANRILSNCYSVLSRFFFQIATTQFLSISDIAIVARSRSGLKFRTVI